MFESEEIEDEQSYDSFVHQVKRLFFQYVSKEDRLSKHDFNVTHGIIGKLQGRKIVYGKYGSMHLFKTCKHYLEGFNLQGNADLSKKVCYLCRKAQFPIPFTRKNQIILSDILSQLDHTIPLRDLVRRMIKQIDREWSIVYSSLYLAVLRYVYFVFLSHSNKDTTLSVSKGTEKLFLTPEGQDFIKDYPLYRYREGKEMLPSGLDWISSPEFSSLEDDIDINVAIPWDYNIDDWEYSLLPIDSEKVSEIAKALHYFGYDEFHHLEFSRIIDLGKLEKYMSDTSYFDDQTYQTEHKIDKLSISMLINEIKEPTIKQFEFLRKVIYVSPNNLRDTFIPSWKTFCAMFVIESLCDKIIDSTPEIRIGKVNSNLHYGKYHIMIDIKKFGITFPKEIILEMISMLEHLYSIDLSIYKEAYKNYILYKDDEIFRPIRGFGLGNFNKLATIAHYLIAKCSNLKFYVYSDDIVYICNRKPSLQVLEDFHTFYESFGLILNSKKCYISESWEFLGESSHEYFEQVESNHCTDLFLNAFFSETRLQGEIAERNALDLYKECRDLWLKNHEIHPLLREDLLCYPESMGGWVRTNTPLSYCDQGGLTPSLFTAIKSPPKKITFQEADEYYDMGNPIDFFINSHIRTLAVSTRNRYSNWKLLQFYIKEEKRYKNAPIGSRSDQSIIQFGIEHYDLPDYMLHFRKSPSQIKSFVKVPSILRGGGLPNPYPVISVRDSDKLLIQKLSYYTDLPIYTKYMMELKKGKGILDLEFPVPPTKTKLYTELSLVMLLIGYEESSFDFPIPYVEKEFNLLFDELDINYITSLGELLGGDIDNEEEEEEEDTLDSLEMFIPIPKFDLQAEEEDTIEVISDEDLESL